MFKSSAVALAGVSCCVLAALVLAVRDEDAEKHATGAKAQSKAIKRSGILSDCEQEVFKAFADNDENIDPGEMRALITKIDHEKGDGDGKVELCEWEAYFQCEDESEEEDIFDKLDKDCDEHLEPEEVEDFFAVIDDGDNKITEDEFDTWLQAKSQCPDNCMDTIFNTIARDDKIDDAEEMETFLTTIEGHADGVDKDEFQRHFPRCEGEAGTVFAKFIASDKNGNGALDHGEMEDVFKAMDTNNDGGVDKCEFISFVSH